MCKTRRYLALGALLTGMMLNAGVSQAIGMMSHGSNCKAYYEGYIPQLRMHETGMANIGAADALVVCPHDTYAGADNGVGGTVYARTGAPFQLLTCIFIRADAWDLNPVVYQNYSSIGGAAAGDYFGFANINTPPALPAAYEDVLSTVCVLPPGAWIKGVYYYDVNS